jgi:hypothetical protein
VVEARYPWRFWRVSLSNYSLTIARESGIIVVHFIHFYAGRRCATSSQLLHKAKHGKKGRNLSWHGVVLVGTCWGRGPNVYSHTPSGLGHAGLECELVCMLLLHSHPISATNFASPLSPRFSGHGNDFQPGRVRLLLAFRYSVI